jgi:Flp pilus assembly protein TadD
MRSHCLGKHRVGFKHLYCFAASLLLLPGFSLAAGLAAVKRNSAQEKHASKSNLGGERRQRDFQAAVSAYAAQRYADAQRMLQPLIAAGPNDFEINELAGLVYVAQGRDEEANAYLARAVRLNPQAAAAVTALAANLLRLHRNSEAEVQLGKAVELEPGSDEANHNLGEFYIQGAKLAQAIPYLRRAQELNPGNYNNGYDLALAYEQTGHLDQARRQLEELIKIHDTAELHDLLGEVAEKSRNYLLSAAQYEQAARKEPSEDNIFDWGAELLLHQAFEPALAVFQTGMERYPRSPRLETSRGIALYGLGRFDEAARAFCQASDLDPSDPLPLVFLGSTLDNFSTSALEEVRQRMQRFVANGPPNASVRYFYAMSLRKRQQEQPGTVSQVEIEALLKSAIVLDSGYADAYLELGIIYAARRQFGEAIDQYRGALKIDPGNAVVHYRLGQALARAGDNAGAQKEFSEFERLRKQQVSDDQKRDASIQQFVYTMRNPGASPKQQQ